MKALVAAALALLPLPALAQANVQSKTTLDPLKLTAAAKRPSLSEAQKAAIRDGLVAVHTQQKAPQGFQPKAGDTLPKPLKPEALPQDIVRKDPAFRELDYAKTASDILVIDPVRKTIVAVIPRKFAADPNAKPLTAAEWAGTRGRALTGHAPQQAGAAPEAHQPAGDSGDVPNGDVNQAKGKK